MVHRDLTGPARVDGNSREEPAKTTRSLARPEPHGPALPARSSSVLHMEAPQPTRAGCQHKRSIIFATLAAATSASATLTTATFATATPTAAVSSIASAATVTTGGDGGRRY